MHDKYITLDYLYDEKKKFEKKRKILLLVPCFNAFYLSVNLTTPINLKPASYSLFK